MAKAATKAAPETEADDDDLPSVVEYSVDLSEQEAPEPLPVGEYVGVISAVAKKMSKKDTVYAEVAFKVGADQYPPDYTEGNPEGTTLMYRRVSLEDNPSARFGAKRFCESIGAPLGKRINLDDWIGLEAVLEVAHETYEDIPRANVIKVRAA